MRRRVPGASGVSLAEKAAQGVGHAAWESKAAESQKDQLGPGLGAPCTALPDKPLSSCAGPAPQLGGGADSTHQRDGTGEAWGVLGSLGRGRLGEFWGGEGEARGVLDILEHHANHTSALPCAAIKLEAQGRNMRITPFTMKVRNTSCSKENPRLSPCPWKPRLECRSPRSKALHRLCFP